MISSFLVVIAVGVGVWDEVDSAVAVAVEDDVGVDGAHDAGEELDDPWLVFPRYYLDVV